MPNISFESLDSIPEGLRESAKQVDGKFVVDVVPGVKLEEFRANNVTLSQQRDAMAGVLTKLKPVIGEDVEAFLTGYTELQGTAQKVKDGSLKTSDAIAIEVDNRVGTMKTDFERQLQEANVARANAERGMTEANTRYDNSIIERGVTSAVLNDKSGANPSALTDILMRAQNVFKVKEGKLVAMDGQAIIYGADGATPMTPMEWLGKLRDAAPYLFRNSNGGGANGGGNNGPAGSGYNGTGMAKEQFDRLPATEKIALGLRLKAERQRTAVR